MALAHRSYRPDFGTQSPKPAATLSYIRDLFDRFRPMTDGTIRIPPPHTIPPVSQMAAATCISSESVFLGRGDREGNNLAAMIGELRSRFLVPDARPWALKSQGSLRRFSVDGVNIVLGGPNLRIVRGDSPLPTPYFPTGPVNSVRLSIGHLREGQPNPRNVTFSPLLLGASLLTVESQVALGSVLQSNCTGPDGKVSTLDRRFVVDVSETKGTGMLPAVVERSVFSLIDGGAGLTEDEREKLATYRCHLASQSRGELELFATPFFPFMLDMSFYAQPDRGLWALDESLHQLHDEIVGRSVNESLFNTE